MSQDKGNTAVGHGMQDRVAMLSLRADGTPDQTPGVQIIGDREFAEKATREQFRQQAASAAQVPTDQASAGGDLPPQDVEDPEIEARRKRNDEAIEAADKAAAATMEALFTEPETAKPAETPKPSKPAASQK